MPYLLVKELQGLGLRVDLLDETADAIVDAEQVITGIKQEPEEGMLVEDIVIDDEVMEDYTIDEEPDAVEFKEEA